MNIGLMSICRGLSSSAGRHCSKKECPTICNDQPTTMSMAVVAHTHATPTSLTVIAVCRRRLDLRLGGIKLSPALHHGRPRLIAVDVEIEPLLA